MSITFSPELKQQVQSLLLQISRNRAAEQKEEHCLMQDHTIDPSDFREQLELLCKRKLATENICAELKSLVFTTTDNLAHQFTVAFIDEEGRDRLAHINCDRVEIKSTLAFHTFIPVSSQFQPQ